MPLIYFVPLNRRKGVREEKRSTSYTFCSGECPRPSCEHKDDDDFASNNKASNNTGTDNSNCSSLQLMVSNFGL